METGNMITSNPIADVPAFITPMAMQIYVIAMAIMVVGGTLVDVIHKQRAILARFTEGTPRLSG